MIRPNRKRRLASRNRMKRVLKRMGRLCAGMAGLTLVLASAWWLNQALSVEVWTIRGVPGYLETAIDTELNTMKTLDFIHARPSRLRRILLARLPDLNDISIARSLPDKLEITARERIPVALWQNPDGKVSLVDGKAVPYRALRRGEQLDLPLLRTFRSDLGEAVNLLLAVKPASNDRYAHLSELISEGNNWRFNFDRGQSWLLPRGDDGQRIRDLIALMQQKRWRGGGWRIDARLPTRWFIRKSKIGGVV